MTAGRKRDSKPRLRSRRKVALAFCLLLGSGAAGLALHGGNALLAGSGRGITLPGGLLRAPTPSASGPATAHQVPIRSPDLPLGVSSRACIYYPPYNNQPIATVFVDPGHGGLDPGAEGVRSDGTRVYEKTLTLAVAEDLAGTLRRDGYGVVLSRTGDSSVAQLPAADVNAGALTAEGDHLDTIARVACANAARAAVLISIHFNAFGDASAGGAETYYDDARPFTTQNQHLGALVQQGLVINLHEAGWPVPDRGVLADSDTGAPALTAEGAAYGHLLELGPAQRGWIAEPSQMPGVLVEPMFVTRPTEADLAATPAGQQTIGRGLAQGLEAFLAGR